MSGLILAVDDEPDVADLFRQQFRKELRETRFVMEFALSAADALVRVRTAEAAKLILILSDINTHGMSGLDLLPRVRQAQPDIQVIIITAYGDDETRRKAAEAGAAGLFTEPIDFPELRGEIGRRVDSDEPFMTAKILVVDDEPDLEDLIRQRFRRQIKEGSIAFGFARDGVEAWLCSPSKAISPWSSPTPTCRAWTD